MEGVKRVPIAITMLAAAMTLILAASVSDPAVSLAAERAVLVEIFYLPHRPAEAVVRDVEGIASRFKGTIVRKYSFEDPASRKLLEKYGLREHMPVAIYINGRNEFVVGGRSISLTNFPKGNAFAPMFEGGWTYEDIEAVLSSARSGR